MVCLAFTVLQEYDPVRTILTNRIPPHPGSSESYLASQEKSTFPEHRVGSNLYTFDIAASAEAKRAAEFHFSATGVTAKLT